jgi:succinate-semialdehyde dehydrogenase / glutarate-semialdehyde dehydrogenase
MRRRCLSGFASSGVERFQRVPSISHPPATGEVTKSFDSISDAELSDALETAHSCYENDWRKRPVGERVAVVKAAAADLRTNVVAHAESITAEVGKLCGTSEAEVVLSAAILDYYADRAEKLLASQHILEFPGAVVETVPIGVILAIEPWNPKPLGIR